ncbi:MAG TPA: phosphate ABC transporter permease PstA [Anaerolinea sp.]|mgnify:CR=1 FL=1|nr:phosphate ABC transporter permease PstA [Anaerolinea sp.]
MSAGISALHSATIHVTKSNYRRRKAANLAMLTITGLMTLLALIPLFWIIGYVVIRGGSHLNLDFFTQLPRPMGMAGGGVVHAIQGTLIMTALAAIFAIPPGVLAAFYAATHPNTPLGVAVRFGTDVLSGVPSIVIGLFGYALIVKPQGHYSALAGGIALAILMLPTIIRTTEEMLKLVPKNLREASLALGGPEWKTALTVVLPAAGNGIVTGFLLALARASGETAPLLFTALGNERYDVVSIIRSGVASSQSIFTILNRILDQPVDSLPLTLWKYAQQPFPERVDQSWTVALVLMLLVLLTNIVARLWLQSRASKLRG